MIRSHLGLGHILLAVGFLLLMMGALYRAATIQEDKLKTQYEREILSWRASRLKKLTTPDGYLTLVGLYWLKAGANTFGTDSSNNLILPPGTAPPFAGIFYSIHPDKVVLGTNDMPLRLNGKPINSAVLKSDEQAQPDVLELGSLLLSVIKRGERYGIRVKDTASSLRLNFPGLDYFPVNRHFKIAADFITYNQPEPVTVPTVLGTIEQMMVPGLVQFSLNGQRCELKPLLADTSAKQLFFIFQDATSGRETYGACRYLYTDLPQNGQVTLDFNKAYTPPCAFTPYATCPLPPAGNVLPVRIEAGEKKYGDH